MKKICRSSLLITTLIGAPLALHASPYFNVEPSSTLTMPDSILPNTVGMADYIITNNTEMARHIYTPLNPQYIIFPIEDNSILNQCRFNDPTYSLGGKQSCIVRIGYRNIHTGTFKLNTFTVCPSPDTTSTTCHYLSQKAVTVASSLGKETSLKITGTPIFAPNENTIFTITNTGSNTAYNVTLGLSQTLRKHLQSGSTSYLTSLAAGQSTQITLKMDNTLPTYNTEYALYMGGSNTPIALQPSVTLKSKLNVTPIFFKNNYEQRMTITNTGNLDVSDINLTIPSSITTLHDVHIDTDNSTCKNGQTLNAGVDCYYLLKASSSSYGSASLPFSFTPQNNDRKTLNIFVGVDSSHLTMPQSSLNSLTNAVITNHRTHGQTTIYNHSLFNATNLQESTNTNSLQISHNNDAHNCGATLLAHHSCQINWQKQHNTRQASLLTVTANHSKPLQIHMLGDSDLSLTANTTSEYLGYRAITLANTGSGTTSYSNLTITNNNSHITSCFADTTGACDATIATNECGPDGSFAQGGSCQLWFKANDSTSLQNNQTGTISVSVTGADSTALIQSFNANYNNMLYAGGDKLKTNTGTLTSSLLTWNGSSWNALVNSSDLGISDADVYALKVYKGNLYIGGGFTKAGSSSINFLTTWNGSDFNQVGNGLAAVSNGKDDGVKAFYLYNNDLYVGGQFVLNDSGNSNDYNQDIDYWDGSSWHGMGADFAPQFPSYEEVKAITHYQESIVVGGTFIYLTPTCDSKDEYKPSFIAYYNSGSKCWGYYHYGYAFAGNIYATDFDNDVNSLLASNSSSDQYIIAGGDFSLANTGGSAPTTDYASNLAINKPSGGWLACSSGFDCSWLGTNGSVQALAGNYASSGSNMYLGGDFTTGYYDGASWVADTTTFSYAGIYGPVGNISEYYSLLRNHNGDEGTNGTVYSLLKNGHLYLGGSFSVPGQAVAQYGSLLTTVGNSSSSISSGSVYALAIAPSLTITAN